MKNLGYSKYLAIIILALSTFAICLAGYRAYLAVTHPVKYRDEIIALSKEYEIPAELIASVINVESSYRANATSSRGALGLMQIKLSTANYVASLFNLDEVTADDLYYATINLRYGTLYLKYLIEKFEVIDTALASYNAGETIVRSWLNDGIHSTDGKTLNDIPYIETKNYVKKINNNITFYKKIY